MRIFSGLLLLSLTLCLGCTSDPRRGRRGVDSSVTPTTDGGVSGRDSGIVLMDSSTPPRDTGTRDSSIPPADTGAGPWVRPSVCATDTVAPFSGAAPCSPSTTSCTDACPDGACVSDCLDADANPDCTTCTNSNLISCFNSNGCQADWNCFSQCAVDQGCTADTAPMGCITDRCGAARDAYTACTAAVPTSAGCGTAWSTCVP